MLPRQERVRQVARLIGHDVFVDCFGPLDSAAPEPAALRALIDERSDEMATALVGEAAASDDVIDPESAQAFVDDRLRTLGDLLTPEQVDRLLTAVIAKTSAW